MINYPTVDSEVFTKKLTVRDYGSRRHESSSKSGRLEESEVEIDSADDEPPRRHRSPSRGPSRTQKDRGRRRSRSQHCDTGRKVNVSLEYCAKQNLKKNRKTRKSSKSGRHHSLVAEVTIPGFTSSSTRDNRRPATLLKEREFSPAGRRRSPSFRSRTCRENSS